MKAHVGIPGNERSDQQAKLHTQAVGPEFLTEGGIRQQLMARRKAERAQVGLPGIPIAEQARASERLA